MSQKSNRPTPSAKNEQGEFAKFDTLVRRVLETPHSKIKAALDAEQDQKRASKVSAVSSRRVSREQD